MSKYVTIVMLVADEHVSDLDPSGVKGTPEYEIRQALAKWTPNDNLHDVRIHYGRPQATAHPGYPNRRY